MRQFINLVSILYSFLLITSCGEIGPSTANSSGKTGEVMIVFNNDAKWESRAGDTIRQFFDQDFEVLPQPEPLFELTHIPMSTFNETPMFQTHHNILTKVTYLYLYSQ